MSHDIRISKIASSSLPYAITRLLSCYLRVRQAVNSFRGTKSSTRIVRTGIPQGPMLSPALFNFNYYIADMPRPTPPGQESLLRCRHHSLCFWTKYPTAGVYNHHLREVGIYLKENTLLISAPKSTVTLFTPYKHIPILLLKTHSYHWSAALKYWE